MITSRILTSLLGALILSFTTLSACAVPETTSGTSAEADSANGAEAGGDGDSKPEKPKKTKKPEPKMTVSQEQALRSAESYLDLQGFSRQGLIDQLSSEYGDGYKVKDATWAVDHLKVDWNEQAVRSAKSYLELQGFSRQGLIEQLSSDYGDQYTVKQATYAANKVGLK